MKILEAYTPAQIRACGQMLERSKDHGLSFEEFLEFTQMVKAQSAHPMMQRFRLTFSVNGESNSSNEMLLGAFNYGTLKVFLKMEGLFQDRSIERKDIKKAIRSLRKVDLSQTRFGRSKH